MKKILIQLDTDPHPSPFDAIAAYDAGVDVVLGFSEVSADDLDDVVQGAVFPRGPDGLANTAFWVGGSNVRDGEAVFEAARKLFFDPFSPSIMLDSDGSNTTAAAGVALVRGAVKLKGSRAAVIGVGPVGLRTAELLRREGAEVDDADVPARRVRGQTPPRVGHLGRPGGGIRGRRAGVQRRARRCAGRSRGGVRRRSGGHADPAPQRLGAGRRRAGSRRLFGGRAGRAWRA